MDIVERLRGDPVWCLNNLDLIADEIERLRAREVELVAEKNAMLLQLTGVRDDIVRP